MKVFTGAVVALLVVVIGVVYFNAKQATEPVNSEPINYVREWDAYTDANCSKADILKEGTDIHVFIEEGQVVPYVIGMDVYKCGDIYLTYSK